MLLRTSVALGVASSLLLTAADAQELTRECAAHVLSRLTFGARPGELDRVLQIGIEKRIEQQLAPVMF